MKTFLSITLNPARLLTRPRISPRSNSYRQLMQLPCRTASCCAPNEIVSIGIYCAAPFRGVEKETLTAKDTNFTKIYEDKKIPYFLDFIFHGLLILFISLSVFGHTDLSIYMFQGMWIPHYISSA